MKHKLFNTNYVALAIAKDADRISGKPKAVWPPLFAKSRSFSGLD